MSETMEHPRIDSEKIVDRYVAGRLSTEEEARFEEHLFQCAGCLEQVEWGTELRGGLREVVVEDAARAKGIFAVGLTAWLRRQRAGRLIAFALGFMVLPAFLLWQQSELTRLRNTSDSGLPEPMGDFRVISLGVVRDAPQPVEVTSATSEEQAFLLSLELPATVAERYRATLRDAAGQVRWQDDHLEPNLYDTLLILLPSSYLSPGTYRISLEALSSSGAEPAGEVAFRVL